MTRRRDRCCEKNGCLWPILNDDLDPGFALKCRMCGSWLSLGESNDSDPRVEIEIDAAYVASRWAGSEAYWLTVEAMSATGGRNQEVIGLARVIAEHGEQGE